MHRLPVVRRSARRRRQGRQRMTKQKIAARTVAVRLQRRGGVAQKIVRLQRRNDPGNAKNCPESLAVAVQRATADRRRVHRVDGRRARGGRAQGMSGLGQALPHCACATHVWSVRPAAGAIAHRSSAHLRYCGRTVSGTRATRNAVRWRSRKPGDPYSWMPLVLRTEACRKCLLSRARTPGATARTRRAARPCPAEGRIEIDRSDLHEVSWRCSRTPNRLNVDRPCRRTRKSLHFVRLRRLNASAPSWCRGRRPPGSSATRQFEMRASMPSRRKSRPIQKVWSASRSGPSCSGPSPPADFSRWPRSSTTVRIWVSARVYSGVCGPV